MQTSRSGSRIIGESAELINVLALARRAAQTDAKVLITGESGVGKDLVARHIHSHSTRRAAPFIAVNCAGLTETLLESELFGHVKGSFTGAYRDKRGKLQLAHGGTLFLDEVGEMSLRMQALLLRFLENGEIQRVGADRAATQVDVRVVAATNRNLAELRRRRPVPRGSALPSARDPHPRAAAARAARRRPGPAAHFFARAARTAGDISPTMRCELLLRYRWPGNVRELQNVVEQAGLASPADDRASAASICRRHRVAETAGQTRERRRQVADDLYEALVERGATRSGSTSIRCFSRETSRGTIMRELVRRGLQETRGRYRGLADALQHVEPHDYQRFHNFLAAHGCKVEFREFRNGDTPQAPPRRVLDPLAASAVSPRDTAATRVPEDP